MKIVKSIALTASLIMFVGCGNPAIYNVSNSGVPAVSKAKIGDDVQKAIHTACIGRGWKVQDISPGIIEATLILRSHTAVVDIKYNAKNYSITYKNSVGLNSNGQTIHKNYNSWIQNLDRDIQKNLALL